MPAAKPVEQINQAAHRPGEGNRNDSMVSRVKARETMSERRRGRPAGSKNKPKTLIPIELADKFLDVVKPILPDEYYKEMRAAVREGKNISTINEAKIMLKLMGPSIWRRLIEESMDPAEQMDPELAAEVGPGPRGSKEFERHINERLKVWFALLQIVDKIERDTEPTENKRQKPLVEVFAGRGFDTGRLRVLVGVESSGMGGSPDATGRSSFGLGAIPDSISQRQIGLSDYEEGKATRILYDTLDRDVSLSQREEEL